MIFTFKRKIKGDDLIKNVYSALSGKYSYDTITFPGEGVFPIIANDSDYHRTRTGHMNYRTIDLAEIGNKCWALGLGKACGDYPAESYENDIIAIGMFETKRMKEDEAKRMNEMPEEYIAKRATEGNFHNSIIHVYNGRLRLIGDFVMPFKMHFNPFGKKMFEQIRSRAPGYIFVERKPGERGNLLATIYPPNGDTGGVFDHPEYPREFTNILLESAQSVLSESE